MSKNFYGTASILERICTGAIEIQHAIKQPWHLTAMDGDGTINVQGETVHPFDVYANNRFIHFLQQPGGCAGIASEELEDFMPFENESITCFLF